MECGLARFSWKGLKTTLKIHTHQKQMTKISNQIPSHDYFGLHIMKTLDRETKKRQTRQA